MTVLGVIALGAALLIVAEFTNLLTITVASRHSPIASAKTGPHHSYAMLPLAALGLLLGLAATRSGSRSALAGVIAVGIVALLIGLLHDLPDAQRSGVVHAVHGLQLAKASPTTGMYLETLGAVLLVVGGVFGLLLRPAAPATREPREGRTR
jgi:hypothetical protein